MAIRVALDRMVPLTEARSRLSEIINKTVGDQFWVLTRRGKPKVAMIDVNYLEQLMRQAWFNNLASRSQAAFNEYLQQHGFDPATVTEEQVAKILRG
ncbi:MAG: type II toxin-antitoxin system Phd/YefM family antitoxin [Chloroflexota bacterium]|nr:type II toxin-antitoxin system Phd/YefM family antitoxin [Chloroflexota bacterium]